MLCSFLFGCESELELRSAIDELESYAAPDGTVDIASLEGLLFARTNEGVWVLEDGTWSLDATLANTGGFYTLQTELGTRLCVQSWSAEPAPDGRRVPVLRCREPDGWNESRGALEWTAPVVRWDYFEPAFRSDGSRPEPDWSYYPISPYDPYDGWYSEPIVTDPPSIVPHGEASTVWVVNERVAIWQDEICTARGPYADDLGGRFLPATGDRCIRSRGEVMVRISHEGQVMRVRLTAGPATEPGSLTFRESASTADGDVWILADSGEANLRVIRLSL